MEVRQEIGKLAVALDNLAEELYKHKAVLDGRSNIRIQLTKHSVEEKIARMQLLIQQLANQFNVGRINEHYERMIKESEGGGV